MNETWDTGDCIGKNCAIAEFLRKVLTIFVSSQEIHQCEYWYPVCYSTYESGACQTTSQLLGVW